MKKLLSALLLLSFLFSSAQIVKNQEWQFNNTVTLDGDVNITSGTPGAGKVLTSDGSGGATWQASGTGAVQSVTRTLTSAEILAIHTTPIVIIPAQGAGTTIVFIQGTYSMSYNTTPYATDITLRIFNGVNVAGQDGGALAATDDYLSVRGMMQNFSTTGGVSLYENVDITVSTPTSNPTAGDSDVTITLFYSVVNL